MVSLKIEGSENDKNFFENEKNESSHIQGRDNLDWKQVAEEYLLKLKEIREEFDDFQCGSRELEAELEIQLENYERQVEELSDSKSKLEKKVDFYKEKYEKTEKQNFTQMQKLQDENIQLKMVRDEMATYIRELEQSNDDLERSKRATICTLEEFDNRVNNLMERNAFLENELEEKELTAAGLHDIDDEDSILKETETSYQVEDRSKDKSFDEVNSSIPETRSISCCSSSSHYSLQLPSESEDERETNLVSLLDLEMEDEPDCLKPIALNSGMEQQRISALDILTDLLWKVGNIEKKFSCNNLSQKATKKSRLSSTDIPIATSLVEKEPEKDTSQKLNNVSKKKKKRFINFSRLVKLSN